MPSRGMGAMQKAKVEGLKRGGSVGTKKKKSVKKSGSKPTNPSLLVRLRKKVNTKPVDENLQKEIVNEHTLNVYQELKQNL